MPDSITYKEHLNTGNYSWKEFEHTIQLNNGDDVEQKSMELINFVQRMIGYDETRKKLDRLASRIEELTTERNALSRQVKELREKYEIERLDSEFLSDLPEFLSNLELGPEPDPDDIPFDDSNF